jgi:Flp pilus assembly protein TadG
MKSLFRRMYQEQDGQALYLVAVLIIVFVGMAAMSIDIGFALHAQRELQASADAAATAGALALPNANAAAIATQYDGELNHKNYKSDLPNVTMVNGTPLVTCVSAAQLQTIGISPAPTCNNAAGGNALAVEEQASVSTFFAKLIGVSSINIRANSLVLQKGSPGTSPEPVNMMLIVDTTASMQNSDSKCTGTGLSNPTREDCVKAGVRTLLSELQPCDPVKGCGTISNGVAQRPYQSVGLAIFPGLTNTSYDVDEYNCQSTTLSTSKGISKYANPTTNPPYFTVVPLSSDYLTSGSTPSLNGSSSDLVKAVDWKDGNSCSSSKYGLQDPGGVSTYYAGVINEAQGGFSKLSGSMNAIIFLSDGDANAGQSNFVSGTGSNYYTNDCQQAVNAAQAATKAGTLVYSIAYGTSTSSTGSCSTDNPRISACTTMSEIASDPTMFYSDDANGCQSADNPNLTSLNQIFAAIGYNFTWTRVLPFSLYQP